MTPVVAASYHPSEWWYGHLGQALDAEAELYRFPAATKDTPGYSWEFRAADLLGDTARRCDAFLGSTYMLHPDLVELPCLTAVWIDYFPEPGIFGDIVPVFDLLFVTCFEGVAMWQGRGIREVHWLPFAFDDLLPIVSPASRTCDLAFVGALDLAIHARRREYLGALSRRFRMNDFRRRYTQAEAAHVYAGAKMVVNLTELRGFNMRNYEAMGQGALLLTPRTGHGIPELFQDGVHLVVYDGLDDLIEKAAYFLCHANEREKIAATGQREVLARHTYRHRAAEFLRVIAQRAECRGKLRSPAGVARAYATFYRHQRRLDKLVTLMRRRDFTFGQRLNGAQKFASCVGSLLWRPC